MNWKIRESNDSDIPFILKSWMVSFRKFSGGAKPPPEIYYQQHQELIKRHLKAMPALMAVSKEDESQIIGYIHATQDAVNYMFTKEAFERLGIATSLLATALPEKRTVQVTHWTTHAMKFRNMDFIYNPYLFYQLEDIYV